MYCRICGDETNTKFHASKRQALCPSCAEETPAKVSRDAFDLAMWGNDIHDVPRLVRSEFYSDYLASEDDLPGYVLSRTSPKPVYTLDGREIDVVDFVRVNSEEEPGKDVVLCASIRALSVGEEMHFRGGAAAHFVLQRVF